MGRRVRISRCACSVIPLSFASGPLICVWISVASGLRSTRQCRRQNPASPLVRLFRSLLVYLEPDACIYFFSLRRAFRGRYTCCVAVRVTCRLIEMVPRVFPRTPRRSSRFVPARVAFDSLDRFKIFTAFRAHVDLVV